MTGSKPEIRNTPTNIFILTISTLSFNIDLNLVFSINVDLI